MFRNHVYPILTAALLGTILTFAPALGQDQTNSDNTSDGNPRVASLGPSNEQVVVTAPRNYQETGVHGALIKTATITGNVRFDDLDLSTPWGKTELKARVRVMASNLCDELARRYPVKADGGPVCYQQALADGMRHADQVLADPRYDYWKP